MHIAPTKQYVAAARRHLSTDLIQSAARNSPAISLLFVVATNCAGVARQSSPFINSKPPSLTAARAQLTSQSSPAIDNSEEDATMTMGISLCCSYLTAAARHDREAIDTALRWQTAQMRCTRKDIEFTSFAFAVMFIWAPMTREWVLLLYIMWCRAPTCCSEK